MFRDRDEAGRLLATALVEYPPERTQLLALAGGGVEVARAAARILGVPVDVIVVEAITPPRDPDVAIGWVTANGAAKLHPERLRRIELPPGYLARETERHRGIAAYREQRIRGDAPPPPLAGKVVVVVADGIEDETGIAAVVVDLRSRARPPAWIAVASPVVWPGPRKRLPAIVDELVLLDTPTAIATVGQDYRDYKPVSDDQVREILEGP